MSKIKSGLKKDNSFNLREDYHKELLRKLNSVRENTIYGGGKDAIEKLHSKNKLHCRERIDLLIDKDSYFMELGLTRRIRNV